MRVGVLSLVVIAAIAVVGVMACSSDRDPKPMTKATSSTPVITGKSKVVPPVIVSTDEVSPSATKPSPAKAIDANTIKFDNGITCIVDTDDDRVEVEGSVISGQSRPLEYLVVTAAGAEHEALINMNGRPSDLKQALELLGMREGKRKLRFRGDPMAPEGSAMSIEVRWKTPEGVEKSVPIEDWVINAQTGKPMERSHWVFTGSATLPVAGSRGGALAADGMGNVVAIWRDPSCVIDNPRESATDDRNWFPNNKAGIPYAGTPLTMIIRPVRLAEKPQEPEGKPGE